MKIIDLKYQSVTPGNPSPNTLGVYASSGSPGVVFVLTSGGVAEQIGIRYTGSLPNTAIATGLSRNDGDNAGISTGVYFGKKYSATVQQTGLGTPDRWLPCVDSAGDNYAIPAYDLR